MPGVSLSAVCAFSAVLSSQTTLALVGVLFDFCELLDLLVLLPFDGVFALNHLMIYQNQSSVITEMSICMVCKNVANYVDLVLFMNNNGILGKTSLETV